MCEILLAGFKRPQPFRRVLPWALELERMGVTGFGWGLAWRQGGEVHGYRHPTRLAEDRAGQERLGEVESSYFLVHLRRPSRLSTIEIEDTQPFVAEDGAFGFAHNGRLDGAEAMRQDFPGQLQGKADSEVGFRLLQSLLGEGREPGAALRLVHQKLGGTANFAFLPAEGEPLLYSGNPGNDCWRFRLDDADLASTSLHSADDALFTLSFPGAVGRGRLHQGEVAQLAVAALS